MLLSIITPTQNRIKFLKKKIRQFDTLYNNFKDFEWILVTEKNDLKTKRTLIFKFLARVSHNFILANPYYAYTLLLNIKYSLFTYFEKKS